MVSRLSSCFFVLWLGVAASGCERLRAYKTAWHQDSDPNRTGTLSVSVEPREGISILLDANRVAQSSPWHAEAMPLGPHVLEVRGMGYYPVTLPVTLERDVPVHIPVRLRVRAPQPFAAEIEAPPAPVAPPKPEPAPPATAPPRAPGPAAAATRAPLPGNTRSLRLTVESRPAAAISVDGIPADADNVIVQHADGVLIIGEMRLAYHVRPGRALELVVPHDGSERSAWWVGSLQVKAKSLVRVSASPVVLRRRIGPKQQVATLRRLD